MADDTELYSGYLPADELARAGLLSGSDDALARATSLFAGPAPSWERPGAFAGIVSSSPAGVDGKRTLGAMTR